MVISVKKAIESAVKVLEQATTEELIDVANLCRNSRNIKIAPSPNQIITNDAKEAFVDALCSGAEDILNKPTEQPPKFINPNIKEPETKDKGQNAIQKEIGMRDRDIIIDSVGKEAQISLDEKCKNQKEVANWLIEYKQKLEIKESQHLQIEEKYIPDYIAGLCNLTPEKTPQKKPSNSTVRSKYNS